VAVGATIGSYGDKPYQVTRSRRPEPGPSRGDRTWRQVGCSADSSATICPILKLTIQAEEIRAIGIRGRCNSRRGLWSGMASNL